MEVNVFSPGGLGSCQRLYGTNFAEAVVAGLERKIDLHQHYGPALDNRRLATL
jgi:glutathione synthase